MPSDVMPRERARPDGPVDDFDAKLTPTERLEQMDAMLRDLEEMRGTPRVKDLLDLAEIELIRKRS